jgi:Bestrophin, RFP-TM, chloride channel
MFLFVFTVPFAMLSDKSSVIAHCFMVFVLTYGFIGLEVVAIELDNPFGRDPNDFNIRCVWHSNTKIAAAPYANIFETCLLSSAMAMTVYEDIYLFINDMDGAEWADKLRTRMQSASGTEAAVAADSTEQSWLLSKTGNTV